MSKETILKSIRANKPSFQPDLRPVESSAEITAAEAVFAVDLEKVFTDSITNAGGEVILCASSKLEATVLKLFPEALDTTRSETQLSYSSSTPLAELDKIETAIFKGHFGVAENGAVWLEDADLPHRIMPFINQQLVLIVDAQTIVPTMREAYSKIKLSDTGYGVFISGPSKTADIEQSLVYGAHGAVRMSVIVVKQDTVIIQN